MSRWMIAPASLALACAYGGQAAAHAFGQRYDLPIPLLLYLIAAAAVVALSFVVAVLFLRAEAIGRGAFGGRRAPAGVIAWVPVWRALGLAAFAGVVAAGFIGIQDSYRNPAPLVVWVVGWVGLSLISGLMGDIWRLISPFAALHDAITWALGRSPSAILCFPAWLGAWPGVALFFGFAWTELLWDGSGHPNEVAGLLVGYAVLTLGGMVVFGRDAWLRGGEIFAIAFGLVAGFAPVRISRSGRRWRLRPYGAGLLPRRPFSASRAAFLLTMLGAVAFDGLSETPAWLDLLHTLRPQGDAAGLALLGLLLVPLLFAALFVLAIGVSRWCGGGGPGLVALVGLFVPALVPIALGYHLAHNLAFLLLGLQYLIPILSDPFGWGWDLFGTRLYMVDFSIANAALLWYAAIGAIVVGHVAAVWLAHIVALRVFPTRIAALRSQLPMLVLMIGYTMSSLWLLAQPITNARTGS